MAEPVQITFEAVPDSGYVRVILLNTPVKGGKAVCATLQYPRQGALIGTERNVLVADALNEAAEELNAQLRSFCS